MVTEVESNILHLVSNIVVDETGMYGVNECGPYKMFWKYKNGRTRLIQFERKDGWRRRDDPDWIEPVFFKTAINQMRAVFAEKRKKNSNRHGHLNISLKPCLFHFKMI